MTSDNNSVCENDWLRVTLSDQIWVSQIMSKCTRWHQLNPHWASHASQVGKWSMAEEARGRAVEKVRHLEYTPTITTLSTSTGHSTQSYPDTQRRLCRRLAASPPRQSR